MKTAQRSNPSALIPDQGFFYDAPSHSYYYDGKPMTGMTTLLGVLNKPALVGWAAKMAVEYIENHLEEPIDSYSSIPGGGMVTSEVLEKAKTAYAKKRDDAASKGTDTHALVELYVNECIQQNSGGARLHVEISPIYGFTKWAVENNIRFISSEQQVYSRNLFVAGTFDLLFEKDGKRYIGDIKTYKKIWDRVPFYQCAGYAYCWEDMERTNFTQAEANEWIENGNGIDGYCIINLPKERTFNPEEDVMWSFDIEGDTAAFLACVTIYRQNANFKTKSTWQR